MGFTIKTTQKGGGGPPSTIVPALKVLNKATANKQAIKASSPDKTFFKDFLSLIELQIINKKPIPKLLAATTSAVPLTRSNVSLEALPAIVSIEKMSREIINDPKRICNAPVVFKIFFNFIKKEFIAFILYRLSIVNKHRPTIKTRNPSRNSNYQRGY